jgi:hypothetical protein
VCKTHWAYWERGPTTAILNTIAVAKEQDIAGEGGGGEGEYAVIFWRIKHFEQGEWTHNYILELWGNIKCASSQKNITLKRRSVRNSGVCGVCGVWNSEI